jgi:hypothetical protein
MALAILKTKRYSREETMTTGFLEFGLPALIAFGFVNVFWAQMLLGDAPTVGREVKRPQTKVDEIDQNAMPKTRAA